MILMNEPMIREKKKEEVTGMMVGGVFTGPKNHQLNMLKRWLKPASNVELLLIIKLDTSPLISRIIMAISMDLVRSQN